MAKAEVIHEAPITPPIKEVVLTLSPDEAAHLHSVLGRVRYGSLDGPDENPELNNAIWKALEAKGIKGYNPKPLSNASSSW